MNATIAHKIKLEASRGEGRHREGDKKSRQDKGHTREESAGNTKNKLRDIERTMSQARHPRHTCHVAPVILKIPSKMHISHSAITHIA
jgi:hypothetical protein